MVMIYGLLAATGLNIHWRRGSGENSRCSVCNILAAMAWPYASPRSQTVHLAESGTLYSDACTELLLEPLPSEYPSSPAEWAGPAPGQRWLG